MENQNVQPTLPPSVYFSFDQLEQIENLKLKLRSGNELTNIVRDRCYKRLFDNSYTKSDTKMIALMTLYIIMKRRSKFYLCRTSGCLNTMLCVSDSNSPIKMRKSLLCWTQLTNTELDRCRVCLERGWS